MLAHIRYRCSTDGPGRVARDGQRWWRTSQSGIACEVGLSVKGVRTALRTLGEAVAAKHFPPLTDQSLAYRPAYTDNSTDLPVADTGEVSNRADLPLAEIGVSVAATGEVPRQNGHGTSPKMAPVPFGKNPEEGGEGGGVPRPPEPRPISPETANSNRSRRRCPRHRHIVRDEDVPPCGGCRDASKAFAAEQREDKRLRAETEANALKDCLMCDEGWVVGPDGKPIEPATRCSHRRCACGAALIRNKSLHVDQCLECQTTGVAS
ncbi:hypothetical protein EV580_3145 [Mycobacterium sp. BK086]|nr:hypothetical protein EV580_3145 [Mycobacterium sp. BK086]